MPDAMNAASWSVQDFQTDSTDAGDGIQAPELDVMQEIDGSNGSIREELKSPRIFYHCLE